MKKFFSKVMSWLGPVLGAGFVGACPLCWAGSAALLTYLGFGALLPVWGWIVGVLLVLGLVGFIFDYRSHGNLWPMAVLIVGGVLLVIGRYVFVAKDWGYWYIWGPGALLVIIAIIWNKRQFKKASATTS